MTLHIDPKTMKGESRVDLSDDGRAGYRAGVRPALTQDEIEYRKNFEALMLETVKRPGWQPPVSIDLSQCNTLHRQKAIAAHKHAIATAETDAYAKPVAIKGIDWTLAVFLVGMALCGIGIGLGIALVMS